MYTDFHAHILPGMDHGSSGLETSLRQLKCAEEHNVSTIIATSHFYPEDQSVFEFLEKRAESLQLLSGAIRPPIKIVPAAEVMITMELPTLANLEKLCITGTNYILVEMPTPIKANWMLDALYKISSVRKLRPIIAHIDRYDSKFSDELIDMGLVIQINAEAFSSALKRKKWIRLIEQNRIHLLGSDVHGSAKEYKDFSHAVKILKHQISTLMKNSNTILQNQLLYTRGSP